MASRRSDEVRAWLATRPTLDEMKVAWPGEWTVVERELDEVVESGDLAVLRSYVQRLAEPTAMGRQARPTISGVDAGTAALIRRHMAAEAVRHLSVRAASGVQTGRVRFNLVNGWLAQRLLFAHDLERKPVSNAWFRLVWPLLWQRRRLMPLVEPKGIYCFYSRALIRELAAVIDGRPVLEVAAGDGTLARFLRAAGVDVVATDDHSWRAVSFPPDVERLDAKSALRRHAPKVVVCSWPPAGNPFEAAIFATRSVETYVVIGSAHALGAGDPAAYAAQRTFAERVDERLSGLVLPPELHSVVRVFDRIG